MTQRGRKEELVLRFLRGGDTGPWVMKLRELLDMKVREKEQEDVEAV
jgi:hypothetical protein